MHRFHGNTFQVIPPIERKPFGIACQQHVGGEFIQIVLTNRPQPEKFLLFATFASISTQPEGVQTEDVKVVGGLKKCAFFVTMETRKCLQTREHGSIRPRRDQNSERSPNFFHLQHFRTTKKERFQHASVDQAQLEVRVRARACDAFD